MDALSIINIPNPYGSIKTGTSSPASIWNTCVCRPPSGQYNHKSSARHRGFFSASTVEHEATRRRPEDKTALQELIALELNWRADYPSWRGPVTPGPASRRGDALAINGFPCVRHKFLRAVDPVRECFIEGLPFLGSRGVWLTKRAPDKPAVTSPSGIPTCPLY